MAKSRTNGAAGSDAWSREAERVRALAPRVGQPLDEEELLLLDVYGLRALRDGLERAASRHGTRRAAAHQLPAFGRLLLREVASAR